VAAAVSNRTDRPTVGLDPTSMLTGEARRRGALACGAHDITLCRDRSAAEGAPRPSKWAPVVGIVIAYLAATESAKRWFFRARGPTPA